MATSQVEEALKRIQTQDGVVGVIIINSDGIPIKSTMDNDVSVRYAGLVQQLMRTAKFMLKEEGDPSNDLKIMRLRTKKNEIMIIPKNGYVMIVIQIPTGARPPM